MRDRSETAEELLFLSFTLHKKLIRPVIQHAKADLSPLQLHVLDTLGENDAVTMTMLATEIRMSKQQMTRIVDTLVAQGIVRRDYDALDRRIIKISLTAAGQAMLAAIKKDACETVAAHLALLDDDALAEIDAAAARLSALLRKLP